MAFRKRVYSTNKKIFIYGGGSLATFLVLLFSLSFYGVNVQTSGDQVCGDTCISYFNISLNEYALCLGSTFTGITVEPNVSYEIYKADARYRSDNPARWKPYEFKANTCLKNGTINEFKLVGHKDPTQTVKWGLTLSGPDKDPFWYGINESAITSVSTNMNIELGTKINFTTNISGITTICVDIDHPDYGINYTCGTPTANFSVNISYFRKTEFNDSATLKTLNYTGSGNQTIYIQGHQYDEVLNFSMNLTGGANGSNYPEDVAIYINDSLIKTIGPLRPVGAEVAINNTNSSSLPEFVLSGTNGTAIRYLKIPKMASVISGVFNFTEYSSATGVATCGTSGYCSNASGELTTCGETDNTNPPGCDNNSNAYDSSPTTYATSLTRGVDAATGYTLHDLNFTWDVNYPAYLLWTVRYSGSSQDGGDGSLAPRYFYFQCYNYDTSSWTTLLTRQCVAGSGAGWCQGSGTPFADTIVISNADSSQIGCMTVNPLKLRVNTTTSVPEADDLSYAYIFEMDTVPTSFGVRWWNVSELHSNLTIEVGAVDGTYEGNYTGTLPFNRSRITNDFNGSIDSFLSTCTESIGYCYVPLYITVAQGGGKLKISNLKVNYTYNPNPVILGPTHIQNYVGNSSVFVNIPIKISSSSAGIINISNLKYDYRGGNDTIGITTYFSGYDDTEDAWTNSSGGGLVNPENAVDENWGTYAARNDVDWSTIFYIFENYTLDASGIDFGTTNFTAKIQCFDDNEYFNFECYNYTASNWVTYYSEDCGVGGGTFIQNKTIPYGCLSTNPLQNRMGMWDGNTGDSNVRYYEGEVYWDVSDALNLTVYYSDFYKNLPYTWTEDIFFLPRTNSSKNVSAYGQTTSIPLFNLTTTNYGGKNVEIVTSLNETNSCIGLYLSSNNTKPMGSLWDGLIAYWPFDIDSRDVSGKDRDGNVRGSAILNNSGKLGGAYSFNGSNGGNINVTQNLSEIQAGNFTLTMWVNLKEIRNNNIDEIYHLGNSPSTNDIAFFIRHQTTGNVNFSRFQIHNTTGWEILDWCNDCTLDDNATFFENTWTHYATAFNGTHMMIYINGSLIKTHLFLGTRGTTQTDTFTIGSEFSGVFSVNGSIDDFRAYNRSLSATEINEIYARSYNEYYDDKLNTELQVIRWDLEYLNNSKMWMWADLSNCNASDRRILNPKISLRSYCADCLWEES